MKNPRVSLAACLVASFLLIFKVDAQSHPDDAAMSGVDMAAMAAHMEVTPHRLASSADSARAQTVAGELRSAIAKYRRKDDY